MMFLIGWIVLGSVFLLGWIVRGAFIFREDEAKAIEELRRYQDWKG